MCARLFIVLGGLMLFSILASAQANKDSILHLQNDTLKTRLIRKQGIPGNAYTVPEGKTWKVKRLLVNNGSYNVLVGSIKYEKVLTSGEKINIPFWSAEGNLLDDDNTSLTYTFEIEEQDN